jgi:site-specific DNA recombinase
MLERFQKFAKFADKSPFVKDLKNAVVYTRVSSKEQKENNLSLDFQKKSILDYSKRNDFTLVEFFGGTYESAKTDGRKEFDRMLNFIRSRKGAISHILVYTTSRFSRTGGAAIKLSEDLFIKYGVQVLAVTQPTDTSTPNGQFQQNIQFLFAQWDNQQRKQATSAGSKEKLEEGQWCLRPPMGYEAIRTNGVRSIIVNKTGEQLRKAFRWKKQGMKNEEILSRLKALGVAIYQQKLSMIFSNPFYCGIIVNKMLNGKLVKGIHPAVVSEGDFLEVNNIRQANGGKYGVSHKREIEMLPLKVFVKCEKCGSSYTGYIVKAKNIYYYKCKKVGCKCNQNAAKLNSQFAEYLSQYSIKDEFIEAVLLGMNKIFNQRNESNQQEIKELQENLGGIQKKIDTIEEKHFVLETMNAETYAKFSTKLREEKLQIQNNIAGCKMKSSNLEEYLRFAFAISAKLTTEWTSSPVGIKERIQKMVFPAGIFYNREKEAVRTDKVNKVFYLIPYLNSVSGDGKQKEDSIHAILTSQVGWTGFEPATPCTPCKCATGLRHHPNCSYLLQQQVVTNGGANVRQKLIFPKSGMPSIDFFSKKGILIAKNVR